MCICIYIYFLLCIVYTDKMYIKLIIWLVVSTPLKNISQLGWLSPNSPIYGKIKNVPNHQPDIYIYIYVNKIHTYEILWMCSQLLLNMFLINWLCCWYVPFFHHHPFHAPAQLICIAPSALGGWMLGLWPDQRTTALRVTILYPSYIRVAYVFIFIYIYMYKNISMSMCITYMYHLYVYAYTVILLICLLLSQIHTWGIVRHPKNGR